MVGTKLELNLERKDVHTKDETWSNEIDDIDRGSVLFSKLVEKCLVLSVCSDTWETVTDTKIPATSKVKRRARTHQHEETRGMNQQKSTIQIKTTMRNYRVVSCKVCWIGYRSSSMDWLMKVFPNIGYFQFFSWITFEPRAKVVPSKTEHLHSFPERL